MRLALGLLAGLGTAEAAAQSLPRSTDDYKIPAAGDVEATAKLGYAFGRIAHRDFDGRSAPGVLIETDLGYRLSASWSVGFQVTGTETPVSKVTSRTYEIRTNPLEPQTGVLHLYATGDAEGPTGLLFASSLRTAIVGPRLEFSPRSVPGGYLGIAGGIGSVSLEETDLASGLSVRGGYRYQFASSVSAGIGVGLTGLFFTVSRAWIPYAAAELRLF